MLDLNYALKTFENSTFSDHALGSLGGDLEEAVGHGHPGLGLVPFVAGPGQLVKGAEGLAVGVPLAVEVDDLLFVGQHVLGRSLDLLEPGQELLVRQRGQVRGHLRGRFRGQRRRESSAVGDLHLRRNGGKN